MLNTFEIRLSAIQDNFSDDGNKTRYKRELQSLKKDVGSHMSEDDSSLKWIYERLNRNIGFVIG